MEGSWTEKDDTSSAKFQSEEAGLVDFVGTEEEILSQIRELVCMIPAITKKTTLTANARTI